MKARSERLARIVTIAAVATCCLGSLVAGARDRKEAVSPGDATYKLFQVLDSSYGGKLTNCYLIADVYPDPSQPGQMLQHVLLVNYDKDRFFGRLSVRVRGVSQLTAEQLKDYTPEQLYDFGSDVEKFEKIDPGPFGKTGDAYFTAVGNRPLTQAPISADARTEYESLLTRYIIPALQKS